ncbi:MAG: PAS domain-containing protein [Flavobacterium sp.]|uniref:PAS domain-containing protein n=1 Tax=Flavobacterium sp. TaxID=239 RepID=UPI002632D820|nr:PAS domain-containing protein [Flavobacterium sp.]MDD5151975.1 PAS domain-containing protein [Flavobacterium sp.]
MIIGFLNIANYKRIDSLNKTGYELIPDALLVFECGSDDCDIKLLNGSIYEMFEISEKDILNKNELAIYERIFPEDRELVLESIICIDEIDNKRDIEFRVLLPQKGLCWFRISINKIKSLDEVVFFYVKISNITDFKNGELKYKIANERFELALEDLNMGVWDWDLRTNIVFFSSQLLKIYELESDGIYEKLSHWNSTIYQDDFEEYHSAMQDYLCNKSPSYENYRRIFTSSGKCKWILDRGRVVERDTNNKPSRMIGSFREISNPKENELESVESLKRVREENKRLMNFSQIVSHNFKNIAGNIRLILDSIDLDTATIDENKKMLFYLQNISNDLDNSLI